MNPWVVCAIICILVAIIAKLKLNQQASLHRIETIGLVEDHITQLKRANELVSRVTEKLKDVAEENALLRKELIIMAMERDNPESLATSGLHRSGNRIH